MVLCFFGDALKLSIIMSFSFNCSLLLIRAWQVTSVDWLMNLSFLLVAERKDRCRGRVVYASLFGVGAPEALVIGVVALLVFGPKGLAEVNFFGCLKKF